MDISAINSIKTLDLYTIQKVLASNKITDGQKTEFMRHYRTEIQKILDIKLSGSEFKYIMKMRPLRKFKPIKNSITKRADKILLAQVLEISPSELDKYIENVRADMENINKLSFLPKDKIDSIKTYVYRHGSKDDIVSFLDYELRCSQDILKTLYRTLDYHTDGLADYFIRPIHKMTNLTMVRLYNVIDNNLEKARACGSVSEEEKNKIARWALIRIHEIQNNSKFINAVKTYKILNG